MVTEVLKHRLWPKSYRSFVLKLVVQYFLNVFWSVVYGADGKGGLQIYGKKWIENERDFIWLLPPHPLPHGTIRRSMLIG